MEINEQELAEAVDKLREGEQVLGVKARSVLINLMESVSFQTEVAVKFYQCDRGIQEYFESEFNKTASSLLREAYRTKLEHEAGL